MSIDSDIFICALRLNLQYKNLNVPIFLRYLIKFLCIKMLFIRVFKEEE
jgi:hypothetical protein